MKKLILALLMVLAASPCFATTYYACIAGNINVSDAWEDAIGCDGNTFTYGTGGFPASGSVLEANGQTMVINVDPGPNGTVTCQTTAGGGFTYANAVAIDIHANFTAGTTNALAVSGTTAATRTITGNITGSAGTAAKYGIYDTRTTNEGTLAIVGDVTAGAGAASAGYYGAHATPMATTISGTSTGSSATHGTVNSTTGLVTVGNCHGASDGVGMGCYASSTGTITVTGNIKNDARGVGVGGTIVWAPSSAQKYIWFTVGTDVYASAGLGSDAGGTQVAAADTAAQVADNYYFVKKDDGVYTEGTKVATGAGGAWAF